MIFQPLSPPPAADTKEQHGHLVTQILETQKELEDDGHHQSQHSQPKKVEIVSCVTEYFTVLHCTPLHRTTLHSTALHCTALHCTALHSTELYLTELYCTELHCTALH